MQLPAKKFHDSEDSPTAMSLNEKEQIILNSGEELFAEIRYIILSIFLYSKASNLIILVEIRILMVLDQFLVRKLK